MIYLTTAAAVFLFLAHPSQNSSFTQASAAVLPAVLLRFANSPRRREGRPILNFPRGGGGRPGQRVPKSRRRTRPRNGKGKANLPPPPSGLVNLGNTCYMNAMLQSMYHIPLVRRLVQSSGDGGASAALRSVFQSLSDQPVGRTDDFCDSLGISRFEQQDASEFWKLLLPALDMPEVSGLYIGKYESYVEATDGRRRVRTETFTDLDAGTEAGTLQAALEEGYGAASEEKVENWRPPPEEGMPDRVDAVRGVRLRIDSLPSVLQVTLRRFTVDYNYGIMKKVNDGLLFDRILNLTGICDGGKDGVDGWEGDEDSGDSPAVYDLQSMIVHSGEYGAGHYYAYVRPDIRKNVWYRIDDSRIMKVRYQDVEIDATGLLPAAYAPRKRTVEGGNVGPIRWFGRLLRRQDRIDHGYGGRESSAYVLQYVRRKDIPILYDSENP
mmetsp:Transcript_12794/g.25539  ORF Transcript_12794/g.25539 Transcript_12794/m.25539 type:complete len:438 (+) Transcript_12794:3-1316(+)